MMKGSEYRSRPIKVRTFLSKIREIRQGLCKIVHEEKEDIMLMGKRNCNMGICRSRHPIGMARVRARGNYLKVHQEAPRVQLEELFFPQKTIMMPACY